MVEVVLGKVTVLFLVINLVMWCVTVVAVNWFFGMPVGEAHIDVLLWYRMKVSAHSAQHGLSRVTQAGVRAPAPPVPVQGDAGVSVPSALPRATPWKSDQTAADCFGFEPMRYCRSS